MQLSWPERNRTPGFLDALGLAGLLGLLVARFIPVARLPFWRCEFRRLTGLPCPGCGLTRVADRFSHGNLAGAFQANPLGTVAAAFFALAAVATVAHLAFAAPMPQLSVTEREARAARWTVLVLAVLNYGFILARTLFPSLL